MKFILWTLVWWAIEIAYCIIYEVILKHEYAPGIFVLGWALHVFFWIFLYYAIIKKEQ